MSDIYKLFTISSGSVSVGAIAEKLTLKSAARDIPAVMVGEKGRGRERDVMPTYLPYELYRTWREKGVVQIIAAKLTKTDAGKPKLEAQDARLSTDDSVLCVFRTKYGHRGGNGHTGDRQGWKCYTFGCASGGTDSLPDECPACGEKASNRHTGPKIFFAEFPGKVQIRGIRADGIAGNMASGEEIVALMPKGVVFRTFYTGELYGEPAEHYYMWDGYNLLATTWEERLEKNPFNEQPDECLESYDAYEGQGVFGGREFWPEEY